MTFTIKPAAPADDRLLIGIAGPQGSGKTVSALRLATGIVQGTNGKICVIDTENKRALRYAKNFTFDHLELDPPFSSARYQEAIEAADAAGYAVIIVDSTSHEHEGPGGHLEQHEALIDKMAGNDYGKREKVKFTAWIKPKAERNRLIQFALQRSKAHIIMCFRAKEKISMVKKDGKIEIVPVGWQLIGGAEFGYEMSVFIMLPPNSQGKPDWSQDACRINDMDGALIKMLHETKQISEETGRKIRELCSNTDDSKKFIILLGDGSKMKFDSIDEWKNWFTQNASKIKTPEQAKSFMDRNNALFGEYRGNSPDQVADVLKLLSDKVVQPTQQKGDDHDSHTAA